MFEKGQMIFESKQQLWVSARNCIEHSLGVNSVSKALTTCQEQNMELCVLS
jgi:hypothetical protein